MTQTFHTGGTWGMVRSHPPGSILCPAHGGAQSEPGGWSDSRPLIGTPLTVNGAAIDILGMRHSKYRPPGVWGGGG